MHFKKFLAEKTDELYRKDEHIKVLNAEINRLHAARRDSESTDQVRKAIFGMFMARQPTFFQTETESPCPGKREPM